MGHETEVRVAETVRMLAGDVTMLLTRALEGIELYTEQTEEEQPEPGQNPRRIETAYGRDIPAPPRAAKATTEEDTLIGIQKKVEAILREQMDNYRDRKRAQRRRQ
jgi:hypothetical protein